VELSIVPEDEVSLLMEDSLSLPAIDLTQSADTFESTDVLALIPAERHEIRLLAARLGNASRSLQPASTGVYARRKPIDALRGLKLPRLASATPPPADPVDQAWRQVLSGVDFLWYVRRRNIRRSADILGEVVDVQQDEFESETALSEKLTELKLKAAFDRVSERSSAVARAELVAGLSSSTEKPGSRLILEGVLQDLDETEKVDRTMVLEAMKKYTNPTVSKGFEAVAATRPELVENTTVVHNLAKAGVLAEFGELIAKTSGEEQTKILDEVERLGKKTGDGAREELALFIKKTLGRL